MIFIKRKALVILTSFCDVLTLTSLCGELASPYDVLASASLAVNYKKRFDFWQRSGKSTIKNKAMESGVIS